MSGENLIESNENGWPGKAEPCPFCGSTHLFIDNAEESYYVGCNACNGLGPSFDSDDEEMTCPTCKATRSPDVEECRAAALALWNNRGIKKRKARVKP